MFEFDVAVDYVDGRRGTYEITLDTLCQFEDIAKVGVPVAFNETNVSLNNLVLLGWLAAQSAGEVVKPVKEWRKTVRKVDFVTPDRPTHAAE